MSIVMMKLYETLSTKFGAENTETLASFVDAKINEKESIMETKIFHKFDILSAKLDTFATKQDVAELKATLDSSATKNDVTKLRADLLQWIITLFLTMLAVMVAVIALFKD